MQWFATIWFGPAAIAVGTACRPHASRCADRFGRVKAVAARSAGARSASLDATTSISDPTATRSQLLTRSPRRHAGGSFGQTLVVLNRGAALPAPNASDRKD